MNFFLILSFQARYTKMTKHLIKVIFLTWAASTTGEYYWIKTCKNTQGLMFTSLFSEIHLLEQLVPYFSFYFGEEALFISRLMGSIFHSNFFFYK